MASDRSVDMLLIGGGVASVRCARTLRRRRFAGSILLVGGEPHVPYNRPPLSKELLRAEIDDALTFAEPPTWYERRNVELRTGTRVMGLDLAARTATLDDGLFVRFERALLATGADPRRPPIRGAEHALLLRTLDDAHHIREVATEGAFAVIIGGGFIGVEVASSLAARGVHATVIEATTRLWGGALGAHLSDWARARLEGAGVRVLTGRTVDAIEPDGVRIGGERIPADLVIAGVGVVPNVEIAERAGLAVEDGIVTDAEHRTSHPAIWAAGDVARFGERRVEHWHAAREAGERAALSMLGEPVPAPPVPWVFSEVAGVAVDVVGAALTWDEERPMPAGSVIAYLERGQVVQLAIIGSAMPADRARELVAQAASAEAVESAVGSAPSD